MTLPQTVLRLALAASLSIAISQAAQAAITDDDDSQPRRPGVLASSAQPPEAETAHQQKRIFGIIPNYRTDRMPVPYKPLRTADKFKLATQDSLDRGTFILAGLFAGLGQLTNAQPEFGQGAAGFGRYYGTSYADFFIGDFMTEAIYPSLLHQDPRFFPLESGSVKRRLWVAVKQIFWTQNDNGTKGPNYSELLGNATAVGISNSYYSSSRHFSDNASKWGSQIGVDMAANILKAFSGDLTRKFSRRR